MEKNRPPFEQFSDITRFEPFRDLQTLFRDFTLPGMREFQHDPRIRLDVSETDQAYTVKADIPGVKKEDISIEIEGSKVSISADVKRETEEKSGETIVRSERYTGRQYRMFTLAHEIDDSQAQATYQDGILELKLPKKAANAGGKRLEIH